MIYEPREDSYMVKRYIEGLDIEGKECLDMGTGSGILAETMLESGADEVLAADINPEAKKELSKDVDFIKSDLFENITGKFDLIVFNPPYLPGNEEIEGSETWKGGKKGTEVTERFLKQAFNYLGEEGIILTVISSLADYGYLEKEYDFEIRESVKISFEELFLVEFKE